MRSKLSKFRNIPRWLLVTVTAFLLLTAGAAGATYSYQAKYRDKIYPGVRIGLLDVSGLTKAQALTYLEGQANSFNSEGIVFQYADKQVRVKPTVSAAQDLDLTYEIFSLDLAGTVDQAFRLGRQGNWLNKFKDQLAAVLEPRFYQIKFSLNKEALIDVLKANFSNFETEPADAKLILGKSGGQLVAAVGPHQSGEVFDYQEAISQAGKALANLQYVTIALNLKEAPARIETAEAEQFIQDFDFAKYLELAPMKLVYQDDFWQVEENDLMAWLDFEKADGELKVVLKGEPMESYLLAIAEEIYQPARDAKFEIKSGRVVEFQSSRQGKSLSLAETVDRLNRALGLALDEVELAVEVVEPKVPTEQVNDLGIKEIVGVGRSNFSGSPKNRRHNIAVGAVALNGLLIKPGEEFSLVGALGKIEESTGYLPELVIKGNRTIPEYGGGLCQIGTTTFRAALASGLNITERRNHSYRVRYYEPAGTDATIYGPKPDLRFVNDTGRHILIQTQIQGDDLIFEFWGASDGRSVEMTEPVIYNIVPPPPTEIIETEDLAPGEKNCTEKAHTGASAEFTYTVRHADGTADERVFKSYYRPWREVCLIGKAPVEKVEDGSGQAGLLEGPATPILLSPDLPTVQ